MPSYELTFTDPRRHLVPVRERIDVSDQVLARLVELDATLSRELDCPLGASIVNSDGNSLSVALAGREWALIISTMAGGDLIDQVRTVNSIDCGGGSTGIYFDQHTELPRSWFISRGVAEEGVLHWLRSGNPDPSLSWSHETY